MVLWMQMGFMPHAILYLI